MSFKHAISALALAAIPAALAAEPWEKIDELPGEVDVELDMGEVFEALDGARLVMQGTFRRENVSWTMETSVSVDCELEFAKIRAIRLLDGDEVLTENVNYQAAFLPINAGSAEAIYYKGLCGREPSVNDAIPEATPEDAGADAPPMPEVLAEEAVPLDEDTGFDDAFAEENAE